MGEKSDKVLKRDSRRELNTKDGDHAFRQKAVVKKQ